jgi:hypothetical protein
MTCRNMAWIVGLIAVALLAAGCNRPAAIPALPLVEVTVSAESSAGRLPDLNETIDRPQVPEVLAASQTPIPLEHVAWSAAPGREPGDTPVGLWVVAKDAVQRISPYTGGTRVVLHRVIVRTRDGRLYFTSQLDAPQDSLVPEKYLDVSLLKFASPHGTLRPDGALAVRSASPVEVARTGFVATVTLKGTALSDTVVVPPEFTGVESVDFSAADGGSGADGGDGSDGRGGPDGHDGSDGSDGSFGGDGWDGSSGTSGGNGTSGERGGDGSRGQDGGDAPAVTVTATPLESPFFEKPLMHLRFAGGRGRAELVLAWGQGLLVVGRGGDGGHGGDGGSGGDGGAGGQGGDGGDGGDGADGDPGRDGRHGSSGRDATATLAGTDGDNGSDGSDGSRGGDGGDGGNGASGGDGGHGGDGGDGGDGGNGGDGARIGVQLDGDAAFRAMVSAALKFNVSGGDAGRGGSGASAGNGGRAGQGGSAGDGGDRGDGGRGGRGGRGGAGGRSFSETQPVPISQPGGRSGSDGRDGSDGSPGTDGSDGHRGTDGRSGDSGDRGTDGRAGVRGDDGKVQYETVIPG